MGTKLTIHVVGPVFARQASGPAICSMSDLCSIHSILPGAAKDMRCTLRGLRRWSCRYCDRGEGGLGTRRTRSEKAGTYPSLGDFFAGWPKQTATAMIAFLILAPNVFFPNQAPGGSIQVMIIARQFHFVSTVPSWTEATSSPRMHHQHGPKCPGQDFPGKTSTHRVRSNRQGLGCS